MATYKDAGVNIEAGDKSSALAYAAAKNTFPGRKGKIGSPVLLEGGFSGLMDFGDFYLCQNDDGVGTKSQIAQLMGKYDTLGYDLLAMVADDLICIGAEGVSISNTIDVDKVDENVIGEMMKGLEKACLEQKMIIPGGEIAEMSDLAKGLIWNATSIGILEKEKFIDGVKVKEGDKIIGLKSRGLRSNGFTLVRYILKEKFGHNWFNEDFDNRKWGEVVLTPSRIFHRDLLSIIGGYKEERKVDVHGIAHTTGGGLPGNIPRVLKGFGAKLDNLIEPHNFMLKLQEIGNVADEEAYQTWNMGVAMSLVVSPNDCSNTIELLNQKNIENKIIGEVIKEPKVYLTSMGFQSKGKIFEFSI
jgi:phosphoribosylformylglycinamidine cyclo-ligase